MVMVGKFLSGTVTRKIVQQCVVFPPDSSVSVLRVLEQIGDSIRECPGAFTGHNHTGIADHFGQRAAVGGNQWHLAGHGLTSGEAETFVLEEHHCDAGTSVKVDDFIEGQTVMEFNPLTEPHRMDKCLGVAALSRRTNEGKSQIWVLLGQLCYCWNEMLCAF